MGRPRYAPLGAFAITGIEQQENYKKLLVSGKTF